jgi:hypothetical protein
MCKFAFNNVSKLGTTFRGQNLLEVNVVASFRVQVPSARLMMMQL